MKFFATSLLAAALTAHNASAAKVGDTICVEGYVMDQYCIDNVFMIDSGRTTLEEPDTHSVHCLVDVGVCVNSMFEILADPVDGSTMYGRGFAIDEASDNGAGKDKILDVARTAGDLSRGCTTCYGEGPQQKGFRAVLNATILEVGSPTLIQLHTAFASNDQVASEIARATNVDNPCMEFFGMERTAMAIASGGDDNNMDGDDGDSSANSLVGGMGKVAALLAAVVLAAF